MTSMKRNRNKQVTRIVAAGLTASMLGGVMLAADADALIEKLVQKGILTSEEAQGLKKEAAEDIKSSVHDALGLPAWIEDVQFGGDFRGRYDSIAGDAPGVVTRNRFRYRLRVGMEARLADQFEVGFKLVSGDA